MKTLLTVENCPIYDNGDGSYSFTAHGRIDTDGIGNHHGDKWAQNDTSLHFEGKALNADEVPFVVLPPQFIKAVAPICLGCLARVEYKGKSVDAVVGDIGPKARLGEHSPAVARALGIDPNPNTGGVDSASVRYTIFPGKPAKIGGRQYKLQSI